MPRAGGQWDERLDRARKLAAAYPFSSEILTFYSKLTACQKNLYLHIESVCGSRSQQRAPLLPALDEVDLSLVLPRWDPFLKTLASEAPVALAEFARDLSGRGLTAGFTIVRTFWPGNRAAQPLDNRFERFCAQAFLQPYAEYLAERAEVPEPLLRPRTCPYCGSPPLAGVLRQEGDGARRSLVCSFCRTEWPYLRIACPACDERDEKKMCVYSTSAFARVRIEACESCRSYIKTVDLTTDGLAVPEVDELAAVPLTLWADEHGYTKVARNVLGL